MVPKMKKAKKEKKLIFYESCRWKFLYLFCTERVGRKKKNVKINFQRNKSYYTRIPKRICKSVNKMKEGENISVFLSYSERPIIFKFMLYWRKKI